MGNASSMLVPTTRYRLANATIELRDVSLGGLDLEDEAVGLEDGGLE